MAKRGAVQTVDVTATGQRWQNRRVSRRAVRLTTGVLALLAGGVSFGLGYLFLREHRARAGLEQQLEPLKAATRRAPGDARAWRELAQALERRGRSPR